VSRRRSSPCPAVRGGGANANGNPNANPNANAKQGAASGMTQPIDDIDVIHTLDDSRSTSAFGVSG
jgi:hypothetical protein